MARLKRRIPRRSGRPRQRPTSVILPGMIFAFTPTVGTNGRVPKAAQPKPTESSFLHIAVLVEQEQPESKEELEALISQYMPPGRIPKFPPPTQPWHQAQEVAYSGWEQRSGRKRATLARKALQISPDGVDAYLLLAHDAPSWEQAAALCTQALAAAERLLGPNFLDEYKGGFWGAALTRPYMRARFALGYCLWRQEKWMDAAAHFRDLLGLNPNDNQGARYTLVAVLLEAGQDREAEQVMARYSDDILCYWAYNRALLEFRRSGNRPQAQKRLRRALDKNPYVPAFLLGKRRIRSYELDIVELGTEQEAIEYQHLYGSAWQKTEGALAWLNAR